MFFQNIYLNAKNNIILLENKVLFISGIHSF